MTARFAHAFVVGGSGMLGGFCQTLIQNSDQVSVMARDATRIRALSSKLNAVPCDYHDFAAVTEALQQSAARYGAPDLMVVWVHGRKPALRRALAQATAGAGRFVQVLGSAHGDPARPERLAEMALLAAGLPVFYQAVVLGFQIENTRARWLNDAEISSGTAAAIASGAPLSIVGTVEPWSARP